MYDIFLVFYGSIHLNLTVKVGIEDTRESIRMVPVEMVDMGNLKMGRLVKMGKFSSLAVLLLQCCEFCGSARCKHIMV